jgi:hypothetical protein
VGTSPRGAVLRPINLNLLDELVVDGHRESDEGRIGHDLSDHAGGARRDPEPVDSDGDHPGAGALLHRLVDGDEIVTIRESVGDGLVLVRKLHLVTYRATDEMIEREERQLTERLGPLTDQVGSR